MGQIQKIVGLSDNSVDSLAKQTLWKAQEESLKGGDPKFDNKSSLL